MKKLALLPMLLLAACSIPDPVPCMTEKEYGTVLEVKGDIREYCGRSGCNSVPSATVSVKMPNGVVRICQASYLTPKMFPAVGEKVSLTLLQRVM
jgi:hypothetical protein